MIVSRLIQVLQSLPQDAEVGYLWDGAVRSSADGAYVARSGQVVIYEAGSVVYSEEERPADAPDQRYWCTPKCEISQEG